MMRQFLLAAAMLLTTEAYASVIFSENFASSTGTAVTPAAIGSVSNSDGLLSGSGDLSTRSGRKAARMFGHRDFIVSNIDVNAYSSGQAFTLNYDLQRATNSNGSYTLQYQFYDGALNSGSWTSVATSLPSADNAFHEVSLGFSKGTTGDQLAFRFANLGSSGPYFVSNLSLNATAVPEPTSLAFAGIACGAALVRRWRKKNVANRAVV